MLLPLHSRYPNLLPIVLIVLIVLIRTLRRFAIQDMNQRPAHDRIVFRVVAEVIWFDCCLATQLSNLVIEMHLVNPVEPETLPARCHPILKIICKDLVAQHSMGDHLLAP
jgi:hypothetical protein